MAWMNLKCKCGHETSMDEFCRTPVFGELPAGQYQCPSCGFAWGKKYTDYKILTAGSEQILIPGKTVLYQREARL